MGGSHKQKIEYKKDPIPTVAGPTKNTQLHNLL